MAGPLGKEQLRPRGAADSDPTTGADGMPAGGVSFWSTLKLELIHRRDFASHPQARAAIFDYIATSYNRERRQIALTFLSPAAFELKAI